MRIQADERRVRRLTLSTCCGIHVVQDGLIATMYVVFPLIAQTFGLSYAQVGVLRAVHTSAMSLLEIPSGLLAERCGERVLLSIGLGLAGLGYLSLSLAATMEAITASLLVAGIGAAFQHALSSSLISSSYVDGVPRRALGTYNSAGDVGKLLFTGAFSLILGFGLGWQQVVMGYGVIALLGGALVGVLLLWLGVGRAQARSDGGAARARGWGVRDRRAFGALTLIVFLDIGVQSGFLTFLAFLMLEKQVATGLAALAVVLTLAGGIVGKFGCGFLADRLGVRRSLIVVELATALALVAVAYAPALLTLCLLPLLGMVLQGSSSITYATVSDLVERHRHARAFAMVYSVSGAAAIAAPVAFGALGDRVGLVPTMLCMAIVVLLPIPLAYVLDRVPSVSTAR